MLRMTCLLTLSLGVIAGASAATGPGYRLGVYEVQSQLGQPLRLAIDVLPEPGAPPAIPCLRLLGEGADAKSAPRTAVFSYAPADNGQPARIYLTGADPVAAPAVHLSLETGCVETARVDLELTIPPEAYAEQRAPEVTQPEPTARVKKKHRHRVKQAL
jgi:hypothetical protein